jgi:glycosyltransferase involved in cell wall biosynthesis
LVNLRHLRTPREAASDTRISVLVPARDEEQRIGPTLRSLQHLRGVAQILVLDDNSSDGTAELVRAAGLELVTGTQEPPPGWLGKPWACQRLADAATGDVLVFIDADVELAPDAAVRAAGLLTDVDLVCPYPRQVTHGWLQRLVQPLLQWSWLTFLPLRLSESAAHPLLSAGNGQFLVTRRDAYTAAGGHAAVRGEVLEDLALVRRFKAAGRRVAMADGTDIATCRMYSSDAELVAGYTKSLHDAFSPPVVVLLGLLYVVPPVAAVFTRDRRTRLAGLAGYAVAVAGRVAVARRTGQPVLDAGAHPASIVALAGLYLRSVSARRRGTLTWRGRALPA